MSPRPYTLECTQQTLVSSTYIYTTVVMLQKISDRNSGVCIMVHSQLLCVFESICTNGENIAQKAQASVWIATQIQTTTKWMKSSISKYTFNAELAWTRL